MEPEEFSRIITECWESIAFYAFDGFRRWGRGVVGLMEEQDSLKQCYIVYDEGKPDPRTTRLIAEYDPAWEVLVQYPQPDGSPVTLRIRTLRTSATPGGYGCSTGWRRMNKIMPGEVMSAGIYLNGGQRVILDRKLWGEYATQPFSVGFDRSRPGLPEPFQV